jgi:hypothetical protein
MTLTSETTVETETPKRGPGRPLGVKNGQGAKKKPKRKPKVVINTEAIIANSAYKNALKEIEALKAQLESAKLHIEKVEKQHKAALIVIGYLERKLFTE